MKAEVKSYPKRLIEVDLPIRRISEHARREKSIRHGHISTLHIWWARRPLAACRAVLCASLWPDPADPNCPELFIEAACEKMVEWTTHERLQILSSESQKRFNAARKQQGLFDDRTQLRGALLDFIADFSNWDNSANNDFLSTSQYLTQIAHEALGGPSGTRPLVIDPFAGGGSIPLEALRIGADAFASDLNPLPVLLNKIVVEYIPKYGAKLATDVRELGGAVRREAEKLLSAYYPKDPNGSIPIAYLWARTITCEGPSCGLEIPLIRNLQLTKKGRRWFLHLTPQQGDVHVEVREGTTDVAGTVRSGSATCPLCNYTTSAKAVKLQLQRKRGGSQTPKLLAVYVEGKTSRHFRSAEKLDNDAVLAACEQASGISLPSDEINPVRPYKNSRGLSAVTRIGINTFADLYTPRQALALTTLQSVVFELTKGISDSEYRPVITTLLHFVVSRYIFQNCAVSRWNATGAKIEGAFGKQALQVVWDFAEANPLSNGSANWNNALDWVVEVVEANVVLPRTGVVEQAAAQDQIIPDDSADALFTDPPYFAAIPYTDLSNVFYVWERTLLQLCYPEMFRAGLIDQSREVIVTNANSGPNGETKSAEFFQREMTKALNSARRSLSPSGIGVIVFADSSTDSWEAILGAVISAGWTVTSSWPIDTELENRTQAQGAASLQSSVHIVCRPREDSSGSLRKDDVGDWSVLLKELPLRIHEWMPRLAQEGIVGADAIFACLGPALEIFSRYSRVEKASGDVVTLKEYLEHVWAAVSKEALSVIFEGASTEGFEPDARLTAMWLWTLAGSDVVDTTRAKEADDEDDGKPANKGKKTGGFSLEYDAARKIAQGLGAHIEDLKHLVELSGETARLLSVAERTAHLFGKAQTEENLKGRKPKKKDQQLDLFAELADEKATEETWTEKTVSKIGETTLDRIHQSMILFATNRGEALKRFLVDDGGGKDPKFWRLAQALSALYPSQTDEKRWVDGVLARKKGLGL